MQKTKEKENTKKKKDPTSGATPQGFETLRMKGQKKNEDDAYFNKVTATTKKPRRKSE